MRYEDSPQARERSERARRMYADYLEGTSLARGRPQVRRREGACPPNLCRRAATAPPARAALAGALDGRR